MGENMSTKLTKSQLKKLVNALDRITDQIDKIANRIPSDLSTTKLGFALSADDQAKVTSAINYLRYARDTLNEIVYKYLKEAFV